MSNHFYHIQLLFTQSYDKRLHEKNLLLFLSKNCDEIRNRKISSLRMNLKIWYRRVEDFLIEKKIPIAWFVSYYEILSMVQHVVDKIRSIIVSVYTYRTVWYVSRRVCKVWNIVVPRENNIKWSVRSVINRDRSSCLVGPVWAIKDFFKCSKNEWRSVKTSELRVEVINYMLASIFCWKTPVTPLSLCNE